MAKAVTCPVCGGDGVVLPKDEGSYSTDYKETCHGCGGKGWVEVSD